MLSESSLGALRELVAVAGIGLQNLVLLPNVQLKRVRVNVIGVKANVPCRLVWDLSPKTIKPTGMVGWWGFVQKLSLAGNQALPVCTLLNF